MYKTIDKIMTKAYEKVKKYLMQEFPHLYFYISPTGYLSCWVRRFNDCDGAAIQLKHQINVGLLLPYQIKYLQELNKKVECVHTQPQEYFYCINCGKVKTMNEYADYVMAATYCKECAKEPEIAKLIAESKEQGYYE